MDSATLLTHEKTCSCDVVAHGRLKWTYGDGIPRLERTGLLMLVYVLRRSGELVLMLFLISSLAFLIFFVAPSNPAALACGSAVTPECIENVEQKWGLDRPVAVQYVDFIRGVVAGRWYPNESTPGAIHCPAPCLGYSFRYEQSVLPLIMARVPATLSIAVGAAFIWLLIGVSLGVLSAVRRGSWLDRSARVIALTGVSLPTFFTGLLALFVFAATFGVVPFGGHVPLVSDDGTGESRWYWLFTRPAETLSNAPDWAHHLILPWLTLAFLFSAMYVRMGRSTMLEVLSEDYIRTARAKGLPERRVTFNHGLRGGVTPLITLFGLDLGALLGGAVITEKIYSVQGVGTLLLNAVQDTDLSMIVATTLLAAIFILLMNLIVDILYRVLDPRLR